MKRTLREFARLCGGRFTGEDREWTAVNNDTRTLQPGQIYLALRGARFDGNEFLPHAAAAGAAAAVIDRPFASPPLPVIEVEDGQLALTRAATAWRGQFTGAVVGVAGSNGKTTVKEMTAAILARRGECLATRGNLNNHIGVPLTLLRLSGAEHSAVIEIGANHAGEVAALLEVARPTVGLITNAGAEHLEGFGDLDGVARAEGEMVAGLDADGVAVINADDPYAAMWRGMTPARVCTFGLDPAADFTARDVSETLTDAGFRTGFTLRSPLGECAVRLNLGGLHNVRNALSAAAAATAAGATLDDVVAGLAGMQRGAGAEGEGGAAAGMVQRYRARGRALQRERAGRTFSIVVVAEGAKPVGGSMVYQGQKDGFAQHARLGGVGEVVGAAIGERTGKDSRTVVLGHLQRGGGPVSSDRLLALRLGTAATRFLEESTDSGMVAARHGTMTLVPLQEATRGIRTVPPDSDVVRAGRELGICFGDEPLERFA